MMKKVGIIRRKIALLLIVALSINSFGAVVSDNDGSAFITKAEFDSLKNNFQSQIDTYNQSIDSKIDGAIAAYLSGIKLSKTQDLQTLNPGVSVKCLEGNIDELFIQNLPDFTFSAWATVCATLASKTSGIWAEFFLLNANIPVPERGTQVVITRQKKNASANLPDGMYSLSYLTTDYLDKFTWQCGYLSYDKNTPRQITANAAFTSGEEYTKKIGWKVTCPADSSGNPDTSKGVNNCIFPYFSAYNAKDTGTSSNRFFEDISSHHVEWVSGGYWSSNSDLKLIEETGAPAFYNNNGCQMIKYNHPVFTTQNSNEHQTEVTALAVNSSKFGQSTALKFPVFRHEVDSGNHFPVNWTRESGDLRVFQKWLPIDVVLPKTKQLYKASMYQYSSTSPKNVIINSEIDYYYGTYTSGCSYAIPTKGWPFVANFSSSDKFYNNLIITSDQIEDGVSYNTSIGKKVDDDWYFRFYAGTPLLYARYDGPCTIKLNADQDLDLWIGTEFSDVLPHNDTHNIPKSKITVDNGVTTTLANAVHLNAGDNELKFDVEKGKTYFIKWAKTGSSGKGGGTVTIPREYQITVSD